MRVGSLFSGIGGLDLALEAFGGEVIWQCDSDPFCRAVLAKHWPGVRCYEDVRDIDASATRVDVVCGGFPCQPVSYNGRRKGAGDIRWLWPEFRRIVAVLRPAAVFVENVPGLLSLGLRSVLGDLAALGFDAEWGTVSACAVGESHTRDRLFILAHAPGQLRKEWLRHGPAGPRALQTGGDRSMPPGIQVESDGCLSRMADDVPRRMDAIRALGNAVVPSQAMRAWETLVARALEAT